MKFKKGMFIDEKTLTKEEAIEFVEFLEEEKLRHEVHLQKFKQISEDDAVTDFSRIIALTVVVRDLDDIEHTNRTIQLLKEKYDL